MSKIQLTRKDADGDYIFTVKVFEEYPNKQEQVLKITEHPFSRKGMLRRYMRNNPNETIEDANRALEEVDRWFVSQGGNNDIEL